MNAYELMVTMADGAHITVTWDGKTGLDACRRYADSHAGCTVFAWRDANRTGLHIGAAPVVEP